MEEETAIQQFERICKKVDITSVTMMYRSPSQETLFKFFKEIKKDCEEKQEKTNSTRQTPTNKEVKQHNIGVSRTKIRFKTRNKPSKGIKISKYNPQKINSRMEEVIKILKNRKVFGLSAEKIGEQLGTSTATAYRSIRRLKTIKIIEPDKSNNTPKQWKLTTKGRGRL